MPGFLHQQLQEATPQLIGNLEVLEILKKHPPHRPYRKRFRHANKVAKQTEEYLETTPCVRIPPEKSQELFEKLYSPKKPRSTNANSDTATTGFGLTHAEAVQCLNMVPTEPVEIHLLVEDLPSRFSEQQEGELLELMKSYDTPKRSREGSPSKKRTIETPTTAIKERKTGDRGKTWV